MFTLQDRISNSYVLALFLFVTLYAIVLLIDGEDAPTSECILQCMFDKTFIGPAFKLVQHFTWRAGTGLKTAHLYTLVLTKYLELLK